MSSPTDEDRLDFLGEAARMSKTSIFFDYDGHGHYRLFISPDFITNNQSSIRDAIDIAIKARKWRKK